MFQFQNIIFVTQVISTSKGSVIFYAIYLPKKCITFLSLQHSSVTNKSVTYFYDHLYRVQNKALLFYKPSASWSPISPCAKRLVITTIIQFSLVACKKKQPHCVKALCNKLNERTINREWKKIRFVSHRRRRDLLLRPYTVLTVFFLYITLLNSQ